MPFRPNIHPILIKERIMADTPIASNLMYVKGIAYTTEGEGQPIILIHGVAASRYDWTSLIPALANAGFQAYALDLPGHGDSDKPDDPNQYHVEIYHNRLQEWIDALKLNLPPILIGHSLGGYLSLVYANRYREKIAGLILIDPLYTPDQLSPLLRIARRRPDLGAKTMRIIPEWLINLLLGWDPGSAADFSPEARQQIANDYKRASPHFVYITQDIPDLTPILTDIEQPTQVIWGEHDLTLSPDSFPRLVQLLKNAKGIPIHSCGHQPHIGKPELVNHLVLDFATALQSAYSFL
jgi:pimeloyl-ACP methyl ester carboxylesterase